MADFYHEHKQLLILCLGQNTIISNAIAPKLPKSSFERPTKSPGVRSDTITEIAIDATGVLRINLAKIPFGLWCKTNPPSQAYAPLLQAV